MLHPDYYLLSWLYPLRINPLKGKFGLIEGNTSPAEKEIQRDELIKTLSELLKQKWVIDANGIMNIKQPSEREKASGRNQTLTDNDRVEYVPHLTSSELEYFTAIPTTITGALKESAPTNGIPIAHPIDGDVIEDLTRARPKPVPIFSSHHKEFIKHYKKIKFWWRPFRGDSTSCH